MFIMSLRNAACFRPASLFSFLDRERSAGKAKLLPVTRKGIIASSAETNDQPCRGITVGWAPHFVAFVAFLPAYRARPGQFSVANWMLAQFLSALVTIFLSTLAPSTAAYNTTGTLRTRIDTFWPGVFAFCDVMTSGTKGHTIRWITPEFRKWTPWLDVMDFKASGSDACNWSLAPEVQSRASNATAPPIPSDQCGSDRKCGFALGTRQSNSLALRQSLPFDATRAVMNAIICPLSTMRAYSAIAHVGMIA